MNKDDEDIALAIATKLGDTPGISYTAVASKAVECGRGQLALKVCMTGLTGLSLGSPLHLTRH